MSRISLKFLVPVIALVPLCGIEAPAQGPTYNLGRTPTDEEIKTCCIPIGPEGKELPPGRGTAKEGAAIFAQRCAMCHGPTGTEAPFLHGRLVGGQGTLTSLSAVKTIGSFYPFATTAFDYIKRAIPQNPIPGALAPCAPWEPAPPPGGGYGTCGTQEGVLSDNDVYALVAFLLYRNGIVKESDVMDAETLPKVPMPNRNGFLPPDPTEWKPGRNSVEPHIAPKGSRAKPAERNP